MRRLVFALLMSLCFSTIAFAQYTTVNGTAVDLAGTHFIYGSYTISLVNTNGQQPLLDGSSSFQQLFSGTLTATGGLPSNMVLPSNGSITPSGTQWSFNICANPEQIAGVFPVPPLPCFTSTQTINGATQNLNLIGNVVIPLVTDQSGSSSLTVTTPLLNSATITGITNSGGISTMTCNVALCGLYAGEQISLGQGFPVSTGCQGNWTVTSTSGNTASFASASCAANAGPYNGQIGQDITSIFLTNAAAGSGNGLAIQEGYDGEAVFLIDQGGLPVTVFDLNSTGQWYLSDIQDGTALGIGADKLICMGGLPTDLNGACTGTGIDNSAGRGKGVFSVVRGVTTQGTGVAAHLTDYVANNISANFGAAGYQAGGGSGAINLVTIGTSGFPAPGDYRITPYFTCTNGTSTGNLRIYFFYFDAATGMLANTYVSSTCETAESGTFKQVQPVMIPAYFNPTGPSTGYIQVYLYQSDGTGFTYNIRLVIESL
jgi:hypothetical protein